MAFGKNIGVCAVTAVKHVIAFATDEDVITILTFHCATFIMANEYVRRISAFTAKTKTDIG